MQGAHAVGALAHGVGVQRQVVLDERGRSNDACLLTLALTERIALSLSRAKSLLIFDFDFGDGAILFTDVRHFSSHTHQKRLPPRNTCTLLPHRTTSQSLRSSNQLEQNHVRLHQPVTPARVAACTDHERAQQVRLFEAAYTSTHLWTACGDQSWLEALATTTAKKHHTFFDVGCNKGYETARMFELFAPAANVHPSNLTRLYGACEAACGQLDCSPPPPASPAHADATMTSICVEASR